MHHLPLARALMTNLCTTYLKYPIFIVSFKLIISFSVSLLILLELLSSIVFILKFDDISLFTTLDLFGIFMIESCFTLLDNCFAILSSDNSFGLLLLSFVILLNGSINIFLILI